MVRIPVQPLDPEQRRRYVIIAVLAAVLAIGFFFLVIALFAGVDLEDDRSVLYEPKNVIEVVFTVCVGTLLSLIGVFVYVTEAIHQDTAAATGRYHWGFYGLLSVLVFALPLVLFVHLAHLVVYV